MSKNKDIVLSDREKGFIEALLDNGGKLQEAAEIAGYSPTYCYQLRDRLSDQIVEATKQYIAMNTLRAAKKMVNALDPVDEPINSLSLFAARDILDRAGIRHEKEVVQQAIAPVIKASIFILPEKKTIEALTTEYTEVGS